MIVITHKSKPVIITGMEHKHKVFIFKEIQYWIMENEISAINASESGDVALSEQLRLTNERLLINCDKIQESIIEDKQPPIYERKELISVRRKKETIVSNTESNVLQEVYDYNPIEFKKFMKNVMLKMDYHELMEFSEEPLWNVGLSITDVIKS